MKTAFVLLVTVAVAMADVKHIIPGFEHVQPAQYPAVKTTQDGYRFNYQLSDGQSREETAQIEVRGPEQAILRVQGSYSYVDPADGQIYTIKYIADDQGYRAEGAHIPVAPKAAGF